MKINHDQPTFRVSTVTHKVNVVLPKALAFPRATATAWLDGDGDLYVKISRADDASGSVRGTAVKDHPNLWLYEWAQAHVVHNGPVPAIDRSPARRVEQTEDSLTIVCSHQAFRQPVQRATPSKQQPQLPLTPAGPKVDAKLSLRELVRQVNVHKDELGEGLVLEILGTGRLRALVEYS